MNLKWLFCGLNHIKLQYLKLPSRSNGTFSPDSSDMDVDNPMMTAVTTISPPTRGYSPYNRSQSEEHILSPCRDLLKSAEFSPVSFCNWFWHSSIVFLVSTFITAKIHWSLDAPWRWVVGQSLGNAVVQTAWTVESLLKVSYIQNEFMRSLFLS